MSDLPLFAIRDAEKAAKLVDAFLDLLRDGAWWKGKTVCDRLHTNDRTVRKIAELSAGRVISGQAGYKLTRAASNEEIDHAERWLISQGRKMIDRAREIRIARNRGVAA